MFGSFVAAHDEVPREIRAADQSKRDWCDSSDSECCGRSGWRWSVSRAAACDTARHIETRSSNCWNEKMCGGQSDVFVSKESSPVPEPEDAMEVNALCEESVDPPDMEAFFDAAGGFYDHYTGEILLRCKSSEWKRKSEKPPNEKVISTKMFHQDKGDEVRSRIVAREYADGVSAPEHRTGTPATWALKLVISGMMSKGRTRQLASHDVSVAFFHAWLERGVWVKPPKDLRLSDHWLWYVVKALYGRRESSKACQEVVREMYTTYGWTLLETVPCLACCGRHDSLAGWNGDDFYTEGEPGALDEAVEMILASFKAKVLPRLGPGASTEGTFLGRILRWSPEGVYMATQRETHFDMFKTT